MSDPASIAAAKWLLPEAERPWSVGNHVEMLVHGGEYFPRIIEVVGAAGPGDRILFTDWRGDPDEKLADDGPTVAELMRDAVRRGVEVRGLLWRSHSDLVSFSAQQNSHLGAQINEAGGEALLDQRVRRGGSHHQKLLVVQHPADADRDRAYVGGIDLCHSRRDDHRPLGDPQPQPMDPRYGDRAPWHDAALELRGPAVHHVAATITERWNDPTRLDHRNPYRILLRRATHMPAHGEPLDTLPAPPSAGRHTVQLLRTYPAKRPAFPFAPDGERTIARAYTYAFARARQLIYVEDQYLWSRDVAETLAAAFRREPRLQVIAVVPRYPDQDGRFGGPPNRYGQIEAIEMLRAAGGERFGVYDLTNEQGVPIYVHAKICVVDDAWMTCGSDNFNRRSWTHDSEATCAVVDPDGALPRQVRTKLWAEHLGRPAADPQLLDLDGAAELWREATSTGTSRARPHRPAEIPRLASLWARPMYHLVYDPDGRPSKLRRRHAF